MVLPLIQLSRWNVRVTTPAAPSTPSRDLSTLTRKPDRGSSSRALLDALLDDELVGTLSTVVDGQPWAVPLLFARDGDRVLLHGSTGAGALRHVAAGAPMAFSVTAIDGIVVAESTFDSSANYRSAVLRGVARNLTGDERADILDRLSERILPGRTGEVRPSTRKEWAATLAMELPIAEGSWTYKERTGGPSAPEEAIDVWCGVIPLRRVAAVPEPAAWSVGPVPASVLAVTEGRR
jgi:nitroimidazol reductase NimA-like FMN-containing flavoprotein (pyridoxamine 5'-phosphate oxidase superfamily)